MRQLHVDLKATWNSSKPKRGIDVLKYENDMFVDMFFDFITLLKLIVVINIFLCHENDIVTSFFEYYFVLVVKYYFLSRSDAICLG